MQKLRQILAVTTVLVGCAAGVDVARADSFLLSPGGQLEPLDTPAGYRYSGARALNNAGIAVGFSGGNGRDRATVWNGSSTTLLEPLPGYQSSAGTDINSLGQVLGLSDCPVVSIGCGDRIHATLWTNGQTIDIGVPMGFDRSVPVAINDSGQVLLRADTHRSNGSHFKAFLWYGGSFRDLGPFDPVALNNFGQVVGRPLGIYPDHTFVPSDINDAGEQVGYIIDRGFFPARYDGITVTILSMSGSGWLNAINTAGDAAGQSDWKLIISRHDSSVETVALPRHFRFSGVSDMNDDGLMVIEGSYISSPIPEPSTFLVLSGPTLALIFASHHKSSKRRRNRTDTERL